jgi:hypothetical protein
MKHKGKARTKAGAEFEGVIVGELLLPNAPLPWEVELILPALAKLLMPTAGTLEVDGNRHARPS